MRKLAWAIAAAASLLIAGVALGVTGDDYDYTISLAVTNTTTDWLGPLPVSMNTGALVSGGWVSADGHDLMFADASQVQVAGTAQDMGDTTSTWWWFADIPASESTQLRAFSIGPTSSAAFPLGGGTDRIEVSDTSSLDVIDDLTVRATIDLAEIPTDETLIVDKGRAYEMGVRDTNEAFGRVNNTYYTSTAAYYPTGSGDYENIAFESGCAPGSHWACMAAGIGTVVYTTSTIAQADVYAFTLPGDSIIDTVTVYMYAKEGIGSAGQMRPILQLNGTSTAGTLIDLTTSYQWYSQALTRPGGGAWTLADTAALQAGASIINNTGLVTSLADLYIEVALDPRAIEVSYSPIDPDTEYDLALTWASSTLSLWVDGILADSYSTTTTSTIFASSDDLVIGEGLIGGIDDVMIGRSSTSSPTWVFDLEFEPAQIAGVQWGNAGNSWEWQGTISDQSTSTNNGTYYITADVSPLTLDAMALTFLGEAPWAVIEQEVEDVTGSPSLDPILTPVPTISNNLWLDPIRDAANDGSAPAAAFWIGLATVIGAVISGVISKKKKSLLLAAIVGGFCYWFVAQISGLTLMPFLILFLVYSFGVVSIHQWLGRA